MSNLKLIQNLRKKLNSLLINKVIPLRDELQMMLKNEAERICPFNVDDIITLDNGKKGIVKEIDYYSLDYEFYYEQFNLPSSHNDIISEELFDYSLDNKRFSITWQISGLRLKKSGDIGKISFAYISPVNYIIDKENKIVKSKNLNDYMANQEIAQLNDLILGDNENDIEN